VRKQPFLNRDRSRGAGGEQGKQEAGEQGSRGVQQNSGRMFVVTGGEDGTGHGDRTVTFGGS